MPCQYRAADVVLLGAGLAALAFLHPEHLFAFAMVLLDFPACAAHALHGDGGVLGRVVGGYVFRAVGRRNPKQLHLVIHREPLYFHPLAAQPLIVEPCQLGNRLIGGEFKQTTLKSHRISDIVCRLLQKKLLRQVRDKPSPEGFLLNLPWRTAGIHDKAVHLD